MLCYALWLHFVWFDSTALRGNVVGSALSPVASIVFVTFMNSWAVVTDPQSPRDRRVAPLRGPKMTAGHMIHVSLKGSKKVIEIY